MLDIVLFQHNSDINRNDEFPMKQHNRMQLSAFIAFAKWNADTITQVGEQLPFETKGKNYHFLDKFRNMLHQRARSSQDNLKLHTVKPLESGPLESGNL